jgi:shikimate 5-dehydrogenase
MYFIGVTTGSSSIHRLFGPWAALAGVPEAVLSGIDIEVDAPPARYQDALRRICSDPESCGALVTTHKVQVYEHARSFFTDFDPDAAALGEVNCIVRRDGRVSGLALDTVTAGLAFREVAPEWPFRGQALILGAGGAAVALATHLLREHRPAQVMLTDVSADRIASVSGLMAASCMRVEGAEGNTILIERMPPGSLIVNATGVGKDRPGSPILAETRFPENSVAWDFNYRGQLLFLDYAKAQSVRAIDGWDYFLHGWSRNMSHVFGFELTPELFAGMRALARVHV